MGRDLFERFPERVAEADEVLGYSIRALCLEDDGTRLDRTEFTQPALYVVSALAYFDRIRQAGEPDFVAGHSLGEYAALLAAESFDFATGLRLVQKRGALMGAIEGGGMAAVLGLDAGRVVALLGQEGALAIDVANYNSPSQTVLAGPLAELERMGPVLAAAGAQVVPLKVKTAFHSRHMKPVRDAFAAFLGGFSFRPLTLPVIANVTARPYRDDAVAATLVEQIDHSVRWVDSVRWLLAEPDPIFEEIGPGRVLTRLIQDIRRKAAE
jgi:malonyl CoA-acyl carrier protein transacylase